MNFNFKSRRQILSNAWSECSNTETNTGTTEKIHVTTDRSADRCSSSSWTEILILWKKFLFQWSEKNPVTASSRITFGLCSIRERALFKQ